MPIRVLVADASSSMRARLLNQLRCDPQIDVVGEASVGDEALRECLALSPDVLILDVGHPNTNAITVLDEIGRAGLPTRVIVLLEEKSSRWLQWAAEAGAVGSLFRERDLAELPALVAAVHAGEVRLPTRLAAALSAAAPARAPHRGRHVLTGREKQVLGLIAQGRTSKDIARELHISARTVDAHRANIMKKLRVHSVAELVRYPVDRRSLDR